MNEQEKEITQLKHQVATLSETVAKITRELDLRYKADQEKDLKTERKFEDLSRRIDRSGI
jgi:hypothetical protein